MSPRRVKNGADSLQVGVVMNEGKAMDAALDRISQLMVENESLREFIATMTLEGEQHGLANRTTHS